MANYKSAYTGTQIDAGIAKANTAIQDVSNKQDTLVSGTNIKTINGNSVLGSGNLVIEGGGEGLSSVAHDETLTGAGTNETPLGVDTTEIATKSDLNGKQATIDSSHKLSSDLVDDTNKTNKFVTSSEKTTWSGKQDQLVSGTNIKTINNTSILGSGNIEVGGGSSTDVQINGTSITSQGEANIVTEGTYNSSTNKIATMSDVPEALTAGANIIIDENNVISSEGGSPSIIFAAADSSAINKKKAHYICTGTNDQDLINSVLSQMTKGELLFLEGTYNISAEVDLKSYVNMTGIGNPVFKLTNRSISTLSQAVTAGDTSIFVSDPENFVLNQKISIGGTGFNYDVAPGCIKSINTDTGEITFYNRDTHAGTGSVGKNNAAGATVYSEPSIFVSWGQTDIKIEGISFDGNRSNLAGYTSDTDFGSNCIQIIGGSRIKVLNNIITECLKHGVLVGWAATDTIVMNNIISNCSTHGIDIYTQTERILLSGNCLTYANIQCHNGQYVNIENNTLKSCSIIQQGGAQYNTIIGNYIEPAARAIQLTGGVSNILISNNTTKGGEYGIQMDGCTKITLTNNNFLNSKGAGIHLYNTTYSNVSDNTLGDVDSNASQAAIKLEQTCTRNKISNNFIRGTSAKTTYGIQELAATSDYNYINNNICYNCGSGIVEKLGTNTVETGNAAMQ